MDLASWVSGDSPKSLSHQIIQELIWPQGLTWRANPPPLEQALATMKAAVENGLTMWNGGEFYGTPEYNSMTIIKEYFTKYPEDADKVFLAMKGGVNLEAIRPDGSPENIRRSLDNILAQLDGKKRVDAFCCARRDPSTPLDVTFGVIQREYIDTGKIGAIMLSECGVDTIKEAVKVAKIVAAELELSLFTPDILKNGIAAACKEHDIPIIAYSPIGKGVSSSLNSPTFDAMFVIFETNTYRCSLVNSRTKKTSRSWEWLPISHDFREKGLSTTSNSSSKSRPWPAIKPARLLSWPSTG